MLNVTTNTLEEKNQISLLNNLLIKAIKMNDNNMVKTLLNQGADPNSFNKKDLDKPMLYIAAEKGFLDIVKVLLMNYADPNAVINSRQTALYIASFNNHTEVAKLLLEYNADPNIAYINGVTPLYLALYKNNLELAKLLLSYDANPDISVDGVSILDLALKQNDRDFLKILFKSQNNLAKQNKTISELNLEFVDALNLGDFLKMKELFNNNPKELQEIIKHYPNALVFAASEGNTAIVKILLKNGLSPNLTVNGQTALYTASLHGFTMIIQELLNAGADLNIANGNITPLAAAIYNDHLKTVEILLKSGAKIINDKLQYLNPLLTAASVNNEKINNLVIEYYLKELKDNPLIIESSNNRSFEVVSVVCKEDPSWAPIEFPQDKVTIYNKCGQDLSYLSIYKNIKVREVENIGYLGGTYLKHIIDNYDDLSDRILFLQGNPYDVNIFLPLARYKGYLASTCHNIIAKCVETTITDQSEDLLGKNWENSLYNKFKFKNVTMSDYSKKYIGDYSPTAKLFITYGAEFAVDAEKIYTHTKEYYENILPEFYESHPMVDHYQERLWDLMLGKLEEYGI